MIREVELKDTKEITNIYNYYILNTTVSFEEEKVTDNEMKKRIEEVTQTLPWLVYVQNEEVQGYAYASKWRARSAYRFAVETSVYVNKENRGQGIGSKLYTELIKKLKEKGIRTIIGGMSLPNETSQKLHERFGFEKVAHFKKVGYKMGKWIDVGYWEYRFE